MLVLLSLFPIYFVLTNSFKTPVAFGQSTLNLPAHPDLGNYLAAWAQVGLPILRTLLIVLVSVLGILLTASLSAYAFAWLRFPGRQALFTLVFVLLLVPAFLTLIPLYLQIKAFGLSNQPLGLILPYIASGQAFSVLVLKTFFEQVPSELLEASRLDGANDAQVIRHVVLPLSLPVLVSVGIINLVPLWNDLLLPQLVLNRSSETATMALVEFQALAQSSTSTNFGALMAGYVLASIPLILIFSFLMRYYVEGLSSGAVKA